MLVRIRATAERFRGSLFYVPLLYVIGALVLAWLLHEIDRAIVDAVATYTFLFTVTVDSARSILSTIAAATITVAGIVFSVTVISVQLASSQFSPRVLRGFLRDRLQQNVIGIVIGTFTYCLLVLATTRLSGPDDDGSVTPSVSVTVGIVLAVASILAIIGFIDHIARSMQVGEIIRRVTEETRARAARLYPNPARDAEPAHTEEVRPPVGEAREVVRAWADGWVQQVDQNAVLAAVPEGAYVKLDTRVGAFVVEDTALVTVWADRDGRESGKRGDGADGGHGGHGGHAGGVDVDVDQLKRAIRLGHARTMQQDVLFGIRQLVDIGLRALSTGVNDPTTATEVIVNLASILADILQRDIPSRVHVHDGRLLVLGIGGDHADHVHHAFDQIRLAGAAHPDVLLRLLWALRDLDGVMAGLGLDHRRPPLRRQAALVMATAEAGDHLEADLEALRAAATDIGVDRDDLPS